MPPASPERHRTRSQVLTFLIEIAELLVHYSQGDEEELQAGRLRHRPQAGPRDPCGPEEPEACTDPGTDCQEIMARRNAPRRIRMMKA